MPRVQPPPPDSRSEDITFPDGTGGPASSVGMTPIDGSGVTSSICPGLGTYDSSGPWWIETQSMSFDYIRIPNGYMNSLDVSLSGVDMTHFLVFTSLAVRVSAKVTATSSTDNYCTSAWTQNQKFELISVSSDLSGNSYGGNTDASTMGPMGSVVTKTEYYKRTPYVPQYGYEEYEEEMEESPGYNYKVWDMGSDKPLGAEMTWGDYYLWFENPDQKGSPAGAWEPFPMLIWQVYSMNGGYNIEAESPVQLWYTINYIGHKTRTGNMLQAYSPDWDNGPYGTHGLAYHPALEHYDYQRHDFSECCV